MSLPPAVMRRLMREISELRKSPPEGIRIRPDEENMSDVIGIIEGPVGTPYAGGYFRVRFAFTDEFPAAPPKCTMITKIFHPNVSAAGEICVNTLKKDWKPTYGIAHILVTVKCLLIYPNPESALDEEAGKLLLENYDTYCSRAKLITSVHATPRARPEEFDTPTTSAASSASPTDSGSTTPSTASEVSTAATTPSSETSPPTSTVSSVPTSRKSSATLSKSPLSATSPTIPQRSPKPLSTADNNVDTVGGKASPDSNQSSGNGPIKGTGDIGVGVNKAVKRAAAGNASTVVEKRKKALKRL